MRTLAVGIFLLCILLPVALVAQTSDVDWVRGTDFSSFHTFTWATGVHPIQDPDANLGMANAVLSELQSKGVEYVQPKDKFDVFVTYNAIVNPDPNDGSRRLITLTVRIFDGRNNTVIWRAGGSVALSSDKDANRSKVRDLLAGMFEKYPPQ